MEQQESPSFWVEIKKYEDLLSKDPNSYCFAPLAELYRKLGMLDDAISIAKKGCEMHLEYVGGYMALGRAYFEKGLKNESRIALEKVVRVTPDNLLAQRLLSQIYIDSDEIESAERSLKHILFQNPGDLESQILLNSLMRTSGDKGRTAVKTKDEAWEVSFDGSENCAAGFLSEEEADDTLDLDDAEILEEFEDTEEIEGLIYPEMSPESVSKATIEGEQQGKDPLNTMTLAELYVSQGFLKRALTIYRELLVAEPENMEFKRRLVELKHEIDMDEARAREHSLEIDIADANAEKETEGLFGMASVVPGEGLMADSERAFAIGPNADAEGHTNAFGLDTHCTEINGVAEAKFDGCFTLPESENVSADNSSLNPGLEHGATIGEFVADTEPLCMEVAGLGELSTIAGYPRTGAVDSVPIGSTVKYGEDFPAHAGEEAVQTLERWLENIRRRR